MRENPLGASSPTFSDIVQKSKLDQGIANGHIANPSRRLALVDVDVVDPIFLRMVHVNAAYLCSFTDTHAGINAEQRSPKQIRCVHFFEIGGWFKQYF